jgi:bacterioferritin-associated ferredoxin
MIHIDRCVCFDRRFDELKELADATRSTSLDMLQNHVDFGMNCGLCKPYVSRMLKTGETVFSEIIISSDFDVDDEDDG